MSIHEHHEELIARISKEFKTIFESSKQAIYIYLDDVHKICNKKFLDLVGYKSLEEVDQTEEAFLQALVADKSQETLVNAYQNAMEKGIGSSFKIAWKKKLGTTVDSNVILVPISFEGHLFALHFISQ